MSVLDVTLLAVVVALVGYLVWTLIFPERFR